MSALPMGLAYTMSQIGLNRFSMLKSSMFEFLYNKNVIFLEFLFKTGPEKRDFLMKFLKKNTLQMSNLSKLDQNLAIGTKNKQI